MSGCRIPRDSGGGGGRAEGRIRDRGGAKSGTMGVVRRKTAETKTLGAWESGRRHKSTTQMSRNGAGELYCTEGTDRGESADENAEWSSADTDELATEEDETAGRAGGGKKDADGNGRGITGKWIRTATWGHIGRRGRHLGGHLRGCRQGGIGRPPWGET